MNAGVEDFVAKDAELLVVPRVVLQKGLELKERLLDLRLHG